MADLEGVPWRELVHAYGAADDTPDLLRRVELGAADAETWEALSASLAHQGTVFPASAAAVPFLLDLIETVEGADLTYLLGLLESIASGESEDPQVSRACLRATKQGLTRFLEILASEEMELVEDDDLPDYRDVTARLFAHVVLHGELTHTELTDPERRSMLTRLVEGQAGAVAAAAAIGLAKGYDPSCALAARDWCEIIVRDFANPISEERLTGSRTLLRSFPEGVRPMLFDALLAGARNADAGDAFELGHAILWLAFHRRLGRSAERPRPFVMIEAVEFPMPCDLGFGPPEIVESVPNQIHWRDITKRPSGVEQIALPYVRRWDMPERLPGFAMAPRRNIADPIAAEHLTQDERRALEVLLAWDVFWRTESDLLMVYGLPIERRKAVDLITSS